MYSEVTKVNAPYCVCFTYTGLSMKFLEPIDVWFVLEHKRHVAVIRKCWLRSKEIRVEAIVGWIQQVYRSRSRFKDTDDYEKGEDIVVNNAVWGNTFNKPLQKRKSSQSVLRPFYISGHTNIHLINNYSTMNTERSKEHYQLII